MEENNGTKGSWSSRIKERLLSGRSRLRASTRGVAHLFALAIGILIIVALVIIAFILSPLIALAALLVFAGMGLIVFGALRGANPWILGPGVLIVILGAIIGLVVAAQGSLHL